MISAIMSSPQIRSALPVQRMDSSAAVTSQEEEKKKKSFVPSVEVSAAQSQAMSPRVGDFLVNQSGRSSDKSSSSSNAISPTGLDGTAPPSPPIGGPPPGPPPSGADGGGHNGQGQGSGQEQGGFSDAESALSLLSGEDATSGSSSGTSSAASGDTGNDGDADDLAAANSNRPQGANTRYAQQQQQANGGGIFNVRFDDVGTYQFAAPA